jgi:hypothetical protein
MRMTTPVALLSLFVLASAPLGAQSVRDGANDSTTRVVVADSSQPVTERAVSNAVKSGAPLTGLRAGVHTRETARAAQPNAVAAAGRMGLGQARAMMVVGAAALITGAIIGGDAGTIIMVGGAVIGLIGLYDYLQ